MRRKNFSFESSTQAIGGNTGAEALEGVGEGLGDGSCVGSALGNILGSSDGKIDVWLLGADDKILGASLRPPHAPQVFVHVSRAGSVTV